MDDVGVKFFLVYEMIEYWKIYVFVLLFCNRLLYERNEDFGYFLDDILGFDYYCYLWF